MALKDRNRERARQEEREKKYSLCSEKSPIGLKQL